MHVNLYYFVIVLEMDNCFLPFIILMGASLGLKRDNIFKN